MHILILPSWYPTPDNPINGSFFREQAAALAAFGHKVTVMAVYSGSKDAVRTEKQTNGNLTEYRIYVRPIRFHLTYFRVLRAMMHLIRQNGKPDIIHVHSYRAARYAQGLQKILKIPYAITEHYSGFQSGVLSEQDLHQASSAFRHSAEVIAVSHGLCETIQPLCCERKVVVIPNIVKGDFFSRTREDIPAAPFRFISVGWLNGNKGMDVVICALRKLLSRDIDVCLTICGDGEKRAEFEAQAGELLNTGRVVFTGNLTREEIGERLSQSHAFVLASRVETFGVVFVEAMACGLPIVMTKTSAWQSLAVPETGLAVPVDDAEALADAMEHVIRNYADYDPETIRRYCREHFSEEAVCRRLTEVYEEVLNK